METQLRQQTEQKLRAEADLMTIRDLCVKLDQQKDALLEQLGDKDAAKVHVNSFLFYSICFIRFYLFVSLLLYIVCTFYLNDFLTLGQYEAQLSRLKAEHCVADDQMTRDRVTVQRLESLLDQARQESIDAQTTSQELQNEIARLKQRISDLQSKLYVMLTEKSDKYSHLYKKWQMFFFNC